MAKHLVKSLKAFAKVEKLKSSLFSVISFSKSSESLLGISVINNFKAGTTLATSCAVFPNKTFTLALIFSVS